MDKTKKELTKELYSKCLRVVDIFRKHLGDEAFLEALTEVTLKHEFCSDFILLLSERYSDKIDSLLEEVEG